MELISDALSVVNDFENNRPIYFKVILPIQDILPNVDFIYYNNRIICQGPQSGRSREGIRSTYLVHRTVTIPPLANSNNNRPVIRPPPNNNNVNVVFEEPVLRPKNPTREQPTIRPISTVSQDTKINENVECGQSTSVTSLIIGGHKINRGQWPWIVAFFYLVRAGHSEFVCGGTLVSSNRKYK